MKEFSAHSYSKVQLSDVNRRAENSEAFFDSCEEQYRAQLKAAVALCTGPKQLILLTGPSSSGKTTTANKIAALIKETGRDASVISLDDFYRNRADIPLKEDGKPDLESVYSLDLDTMRECFAELFRSGKAMLPRYDFNISRRADDWHEAHCSPGEILIVEGIHALHPEVTSLMDEEKVLRLYVSARTKYMDGEEDALIPKQLRLIRRMIRDCKFRNTSPAQTLLFWEGVCAGEREYINPYRDTAAYKIDSVMDYEPGVYRTLLTPFLEKELAMQIQSDGDITFAVEEQSHDSLLEELLHALSRFEPLSADLIPEDSVVREFLGGKF